MSNDDLLMEWRDQRKRLATLEASLIYAVDLLIEATPHTEKQKRLHTEIRSFLLNVPVGGR